MWELDYKESWVLKNWCFWTLMLEKTLESHLDCKEIQPVHPKGNQSWIFIGRTDAETETPIVWPPDAINWLIWKDPEAGKDWWREEKGMAEDEMFWWYHRLNTWVWVNSWSWWWTGRPGMLRSMGSQRAGHDWVTELTDCPVCMFLRRQERWSSMPISLRIFQFVVIHKVKGFSRVSEAYVDVFLESSCFFYDA